MNKFIISGSLIAIIAYLTAAVSLYIQQRNYIYFQTPEIDSVNEQEISIINNNTLLKGWIINQNQPNAIIYFGGNSEQISDNIPDFKDILKNSTVYLINYRGYGKSEGTQSESNFYSDALKIYDTISPNHRSVSVIGRSLGSGIATYLAANKKINKLVLITPYDSINNMAKSAYPIFPIDLMLKDKFDSLSRADAIKSPTLIFMAETDNVVQHKHTENLIRKLPKNLLTVKYVKNSDHSSITDQQAYKQDLKSWFE